MFARESVPFFSVTSRSVNASTAERGLLLGVMANYLGTLDARDNDTHTVFRKTVLWDQVTRQFNTKSSVTRSKHQIQTLYKNMKAKAKKYQARMIESQMENVPPPEPDPVSELLLQLLAGEFEQRRQLLEQTARFAAGEINAIAAGEGVGESTVTQKEESDVGSAEVKENEDQGRTTSMPNQLMEVKFSEENDEDSLDPLSMTTQEEESLPSSPENKDDTSLLDVKCPLRLGRNKLGNPEVREENADFRQEYNVSPCQNSEKSNVYTEHGVEKSKTKAPEMASTKPSISPFSIFGSKRPRLSVYSSILDGLKVPLGTARMGDIDEPVQKSSKNVESSMHTNSKMSEDSNQKDKESNHSATLNCSKFTKPKCCCPELHSQILEIALEEHKLNMKCAEERNLAKKEEHFAKMQLLQLKMKIAKAKLKHLNDVDSDDDDRFNGTPEYDHDTFAARSTCVGNIIEKNVSRVPRLTPTISSSDDNHVGMFTQLVNDTSIVNFAERISRSPKPL